jgi:hypothetical protein
MLPEHPMFDGDIYATESKEGYVFREQCGVLQMKMWCGPTNFYLTQTGRNIHFENRIKYLGVIFDRRIMC